MSAAAVSNILLRGKFTDLLVAYLVSKTPSPVLIGDGESPASGGWTQEQAGYGNFVPYVTLTTGPANPNPAMPESLARRHDNAWILRYTLRGLGGNRSQCDFAMDSVRAILSTLHSQVYACGQGGSSFQVQKSDYLQLGQLVRNDQTDPSYYECVDTLEIWLEKH